MIAGAALLRPLSLRVSLMVMSCTTVDSGTVKAMLASRVVRVPATLESLTPSTALTLKLFSSTRPFTSAGLMAAVMVAVPVDWAPLWGFI